MSEVFITDWINVRARSNRFDTLLENYYLKHS